jgi:hypothetical protein
MSKNQHNMDRSERSENQNNQMSDDPRDGSRNSDTIGQASAPNAMELKKPSQDAQNKATIEEFGREGAGIAAKE